MNKMCALCRDYGVNENCICQKNKNIKEVKSIKKIECLKVDDRIWDGKNWYIKN